MKNILLTIAYDGSGFHGWQRQADARTVQGELENALFISFGSEITVDGTSRTDTGVHAFGQRASFRCGANVPIEKLPMILNNSLANGKIFNERIPGEISIVKAEEVPDDFHARFNSVGKTYIYKILSAKEKDIFKRNYCCQISKPLDVNAMQEVSQYIIGTHDFKSFETTGGTPRESTVRTIYDLTISENKIGNAPNTCDESSNACDDLSENSKEITIKITGDGFLYNMVRIIAGTLIEVGLGKRTPQSVESTINAMDRKEAGHTAPPGGLYLKEVYYNKDAMTKDAITKESK